MQCWVAAPPTFHLQTPAPQNNDLKNCGDHLHFSGSGISKDIITRNVEFIDASSFDIRYVLSLFWFWRVLCLWLVWVDSQESNWSSLYFPNKWSVIWRHQQGAALLWPGIGVLVTRPMFGAGTMLALTPTIAYPPGHHHHQHHLRSLETLQSYYTQTARSYLWAE